MKKLKSFFLIFFFPLFGFAQSLNGVYTGVLSNDSTTVRKDQSFEMALTEYKGNVYGYAYSTFIVNDTLYYIVKRVKGKVEGNICEVEDDEVISHNFPQKPEKKVFVTYTLRRNASDSIWRLDGNWKTNLTKKYYAISGTVETKEEKDLSKSKLYEHLGDLDLQKTLAFNKPKETTPEKKPVKGKENKNDVVKNTVKKEEKKNVKPAETKPVDKKPDASLAKAETKAPENKTTSTVVNNQPKQTEKKEAVVANTNIVDKKPESNIAKTDTKLPDNKTTSVPVNNQPDQTVKKDVVVANTNIVDKKPESNIAKTDTKLPDNKTTSVPVNNQPEQTVKKDVVVANTNTIDKKPENNIAKTDTKLPDNKTTSVPVNNQPDQTVKKDVVVSNTNTIAKKPEASIVKSDNKLPDNKTSSPIVNNQPNQNVKKDVVTTNTVKPETKQPEKKLVSVPVSYQPPANTPNDKKPETSIAKQENKLPDPKTVSTSTNNPVTQNEKKDVAASQKKSEAEFEFQELKKTNRTLKPAAALVDGRVSIPSETIFFKSDSLSIALYDNGEVDGDTVSVIINDELFIEKQGLRSSAFRKTFYIPNDGNDSLLVVLYAENLGKYPPNTGLLQIKDGEEIFYVRFKADLDRNAALVLRRKSKQ